MSLDETLFFIKVTEDIFGLSRHAFSFLFHMFLLFVFLEIHRKFWTQHITPNPASLLKSVRTDAKKSIFLFSIAINFEKTKQITDTFKTDHFCNCVCLYTNFRRGVPTRNDALKHPLSVRLARREVPSSALTAPFVTGCHLPLHSLSQHFPLIFPSPIWAAISLFSPPFPWYSTAVSPALPLSFLTVTHP